MNTLRGLPLLSGSPPEPTRSEPTCRKCNKEFNILFARSKRCNHCGESTLRIIHIPRIEPLPLKAIRTAQVALDTPRSCHDRTEVTTPSPFVPSASIISQVGRCPPGLRAHLTYCTVTAGSKNYLMSLSLGKLKKYADAYNLRFDQIIEKDDLVDKLISYRVSPIVPEHIPPWLIPRAETERMPTPGK